MQRARMPHPAGQRVQVVNRVVDSPLGGTGTHGQFCVQMAESSSTFHGTGVNIIPAAEPTANFKISLLLIFMSAL